MKTWAVIFWIPTNRTAVFVCKCCEFRFGYVVVTLLLMRLLAQVQFSQCGSSISPQVAYATTYVFDLLFIARMDFTKCLGSSVFGKYVVGEWMHSSPVAIRRGRVLQSKMIHFVSVWFTLEIEVTIEQIAKSSHLDLLSTYQFSLMHVSFPTTL